LVEIMKQGQYAPVPVEEEIVQIFAGTGLPDAGVTGMIDDIPIGDVQRFIDELMEHVRSRHASILDSIRSTGDLPDEAARELAKAIEDFKATFKKSEE
jgi:F-type H+-transporting ATPase subunit alpha